MSLSISVALCTFNGARFIEEQLESILSQSTRPQQIVISDDASTDATLDIVASVVSADAVSAPTHPVDVTILRNAKPLGVARNFEKAIRVSTGDLIALSDQDDVWHPDRLSRSAEEFELRLDLDLIFSDARLVNANGASLERSLFEVLEITAADRLALHSGDAIPIFFKRNIATGATMMFRRRLLESALPFATNWVHDEWLAIVAAATGRVDIVDDALIDYRQHGSNQIGVSYPTLRRKVTRALEPRGNRNERLSLQFAEFADRMTESHVRVPTGLPPQARIKAAFELFRQDLSPHRIRRIGPILHANRHGWYLQFASQGRLDMLRDLLQSHGE